MTVCIGWLTAEHAFLIVDSAVTLEGPNVGRRLEVAETTFGESEVHEGDRVVAEGGSKLFRLRQNVVAALAGEVEPAMPVLRLLRYALMERADVRSCLAEVQHRVLNFTLGVAGFEGTSPRLWIASDGRIREEYLPNRVHVWGQSPNGPLGLKVKELVNRVACPNPGTFLGRSLSAVQLALAGAGTIADGVGGACFGAWVGRDALRFSPDAAYLSYGSLPNGTLSVDRAIFCGTRLGVQYSSAFAFRDQSNVCSPHTCVFESDEPFTTRSHLMRAYESLVRTAPRPEIATLVDRATNSMVFVPLTERSDLLHLRVRSDRVEYRVHRALTDWIEDLNRGAGPNQYGLMCVTKDSPRRGERILPESAHRDHRNRTIVIGRIGGS